MSQWSWQLDGWIVAAGILCAVAASLLGNFLVLRRMSMLGDAITHAVLPGLATAFLISESRSSVPMFVGAAIVGVLTALFTEWIRRFGRVDEGASMGVVFTSLFALGLVMIVQAADHVDLDASCVLFGAIEYTPLDTIRVRGIEVPRAVIVLGINALLNLLFVVLFYKELKLSSFDPALATTTGFSATTMHYLLMVFVAVTAVAAFESVGNILVVAMFIVPPATAYMLTDRLARMIVLSAVIAIVSAIGGHLAAIEVPRWFGFRSTTTAGMMAVVSGVMLLFASLFGPQYGIVTSLVRRKRLATQILADDIVSLLFRREEEGGAEPIAAVNLQRFLLCGPLTLKLAMQQLLRTGAIKSVRNALQLTDAGRNRAQNLVRSHRLWESYLTDQAGMSSQRVHTPAEQLEHFTDSRLRLQLNEATGETQTDPHGRQIPNEVPEQP